MAVVPGGKCGSRSWWRSCCIQPQVVRLAPQSGSLSHHFLATYEGIRKWFKLYVRDRRQ